MTEKILENEEKKDETLPISEGKSISPDIVTGNISSSLLTASKYQTHLAKNEGIKIFTGTPTTINGDTGTFLPTLNAEPASPYNGAMWTNPTYVYTVDSAYATAVQGASFKYTIWKGFTYLQNAIPADATITGITVKCYGSVDTVAYIPKPTFQIKLSKDGSTVVGNAKNTGILTTADALVIAGASDDLWGTTWERADFTSNFGVMITGSGVTTPSTTYKIDYIQVVVHYSRTFINAFGETIAEGFIELWNGIGQNPLLYLKKNTADLYIDKANLYLKGGLNVEPIEIIVGNTGTKLPTANAEPASPYNGQMWANPENAYTNNSAYATAVTDQKFTIWKTFNLLDLIPGGAIITGIKVDVEGKVSSGTGTIGAKLSKDGSTLIGDSKISSAFTTSDSVVTLGGSEDLWGTTWVKGDFGSNFGVMIFQNTVSEVVYSIDYIQITVYYTITTDSTIGSNLLPAKDDTYNLGSSSKRFGTIYVRDIEWSSLATKVVYPFSTGDILLKSADTERWTESSTYVKLKEIQLGVIGGTLRIKFDMRRGTSGIVYGRIYKNNVAIGTERSTNSVSFVTFEEDISGWLPGDLIQLYAHDKTPAVTCTVGNFRIYANVPELITTITD